MASLGRILLVEDDKYFNKLIFDRLSLENHEVESVLDGETAWSKLEEARLQNRPFSILISDMLIPRLMGAELFSRIRESNNHEHLSLIAISGIYKDPSQIQEISTLHGLKAYWTKPFDLNVFVRALKDPSLAEEAKHSELNAEPAFQIKGRLEKHRIEELLLEAYHQGFTGKLCLKNEKLDRVLFFSNGFPVSVESSAIGESLGQSLLELKLIDRATQEKASERMVLEGLQFGQMLLKMEVLSKEQLFQAIRKHTYRLLLNTFIWKDGDFEWQRMSQLPEYVLPLEFNPMILMVKAHRGLYSSEFLKQLFDSKGDSYPVLSPRAIQILPLFNLDPSSLQFLSSLSPTDIFSDLIKKIPDAAQEIFLRVLFVLETLRLLDWNHEASQEGSAGSSVQRAHFEDNFHAAEKSKEERAQMLGRLQADYMELLGQTYFQVFDLQEVLPIDHEHLEESYRHLRVRYHPDRMDSELMSGEVQRILDDMLARIDRAYQTLASEESSKQYLKSLKSQREDSASDSKRYLEAQEKFREGERLLSNQNFEGALKSFMAAQSCWGRSIEYELYVIYVGFRIALKDNAVETEIQKRLQKLRNTAFEHPTSDVGFVLLGRSYALINKNDLAKESFQMALRANEANEEASLALGRMGQQDFNNERLSRVIRSSKERIRKYLVYAALIFAAIGAYVTQDYWLKIEDKEVTTYQPEMFKDIFPVISARGKAPVAKITIEEGKLSPMPDSVLLTKCVQAGQKLKAYGIVEIYLLDQKQGLKAHCRGEKLKRYAQ